MLSWSFIVFRRVRATFLASFSSFFANFSRFFNVFRTFLKISFFSPSFFLISLVLILISSSTSFVRFFFVILNPDCKSRIEYSIAVFSTGAISGFFSSSFNCFTFCLYVASSSANWFSIMAIDSFVAWISLLISTTSGRASTASKNFVPFNVFEEHLSRIAAYELALY